MAEAASSESIALAPCIGRIPVRNLWLLMLYASDLFRISGVGKVAIEDNPDELADLVAELLAHAVEERQHRSLSFAYQSSEAILNRVRGRINVLETERHQLLSRGMVACRFDDHTVNTPRNRFVRAALESISRIVRRADVAHRCRSLAKAMNAMGVSGGAPTRSEMSKDRFGRHDSDDQLMVAAAKLAFELALPTEEAGSHLMSLPDREAVWVRLLFEKAVGGFYRVVLPPDGWRVHMGSPLQWQIAKRSVGIADILPTMRTDVVLDHDESGLRLVIDTKFTSLLTKGWYRDTVIRSAYVYQMFAYLQSQSGRGDAAADRASGVLLHPAVGETVDEAVMIQGHEMRFATVDLTASAREIRAQLLRLCQPTFH